MDLAPALARGGGNGSQYFTARLIAVDNEAGRVQVSVHGSEPVWLPFLSGVYEDAEYVVGMVDAKGERWIHGPTVPPDPAEVPPPPEAAPPAPAQQDADQQVQTSMATIRPVWSGTWRHIRADWDRWNAGRYGGRSTVWQGNAHGSGPLTGLAVYGAQVAALGALEIVSMVVSTPRVDGSGDVTLQGSPQGSAPSGAPVSSGVTASGGSKVALPAPLREDFRTEKVKGLATVGGNYRATYGAARASGMSIAVTYKRPR